MKIVCDSCGAKYSIADEKVAGKVFKIRCKKCSSVIVVRGDQVAGAADTGGAEGQDDAVWHVVLDGEQQGPYSVTQIGDLVAERRMDAETYVWREGYENWLVAREVPELAEAFGGGSASLSSAPPPEPAESMSAPNGARSAGANRDSEVSDAASAGAATPGGGLFGGFGDSGGMAHRTSRDAGVDLFAQADAASEPFGGDEEDVVASPAGGGSPRVTQSQAMTGQRNENSVLFSLSNLQALATGAPGQSPPAAAPTPGHASGEGSGLIDIRALATATAAQRPGAGPAKGERVDDLLSIGSGPGFGSTLTAPVLGPVAEPEKSNKTVVLAAVGVGGALIVAAIALIVVMKRDTTPAEVAAVTPTAAVAPAGAGASAPSPATGATAAQPTPPAPTPVAPAAVAANEATDEEVDEGEDHGDDGESGRRRRSGRRDTRSSASSPSSAAATPAPAASAASAPTKTAARGGGSRDLDSLLDNALGGSGGAGGGRAAAPDANLPELPDRDAVRGALQSVTSAVAACGQGQHGTAVVAVTVAGSTGRVRSAEVSGQFQGTPIGSCVARAVRGARFPKFKRDAFSVNFPYRL